LEKQHKIYLRPGEKSPGNIAMKTGSRGGHYYESRNQIAERPSANKESITAKKESISRFIRSNKVVNKSSLVHEIALLKRYLKDTDDYEIEEKIGDLEFIETVFGSKMDNQIIINNEQGTQAVGWYSIGENKTNGKKYVILEELATHPNNLLWNPNKSKRVRGSGTAVIRELIKEAEKLRADVVYINSPGAEVLKFYKKAGFTIKGEEAFLTSDKFNSLFEATNE